MSVEEWITSSSGRLEEVLEGHVVLAPLDKVGVGHGVVCLEDEILEEHDAG